jgi:hypothetical protein
MKYKLLGILIVTTLLVNIVSVAEPISDNFKKSQTTNLDDPVPTWKVKDSWTYTIHDFTIDYEYDSLKIFLTGRIDDFKWTVKDTSGGEYKVAVSGKIAATTYDVYLPFSSSVLHISGSIKPLLTKLSGTIIFSQLDLELKDISAKIIGITAAKIGPIPIALPIPIKISLDSELSTILPIFDFPLYDNKFWNLPSIVIKGKVNAGGIFGIINYPITITKSYSFIPLAFHCHPKNDITVEAGTYSAYKITSILFDMFEYYYAPSVGNIIKIDATMPNGEIHGELKSTTYS